MATTHTTLRLGDETLERLAYLAKLSGQSQAKVVQMLVDGATDWILGWSVSQGLELTPDLVCRGGTIVSVEEQHALRQLNRLLSESYAPQGFER